MLSAVPASRAPGGTVNDALQLRERESLVRGCGRSLAEPLGIPPRTRPRDRRDCRLRAAVAPVVPALVDLTPRALARGRRRPSCGRAPLCLVARDELVDLVGRAELGQRGVCVTDRGEA